MRHKNTSLQPVPLASGRVLAPGDITRNDELAGADGTIDPGDQARIDEGHLTEIPEQVGNDPFPGYRDASVDTVKDRIDATTEGERRESLKAAIRHAEQARARPRQGVLDATEPADAGEPQADAATAAADDTGVNAEKESND